jgi:hypothetical protein
MDRAAASKLTLAATYLLAMLSNGALAWTPVLTCMPDLATRNSITLQFNATGSQGAPQHAIQFTSQAAYTAGNWSKACQVKRFFVYLGAAHSVDSTEHFRNVGLPIT